MEAISHYHDLWILTGDREPFPAGEYRYREEIEDELRRRPELKERLRFYHIPKKRCMWLEKVWPPSYLWFYKTWERRAFGLGARLHDEVGFDLVHQLTYVGFRVPGYLWKLDVPFVWGPIGGLENTPWHLLPVLGVKGSMYYAARNLVNSLHKRLLLRPKRAFRRARGGIIAATGGIRREIARVYGEDSEVICETGPPRQIAQTHSVRVDGDPLRIAWSGDHTPGKALPLLLRALALLPPEVVWALDILGEGPCSPKWQRLALRLKVDDRCRWRGWLPREKAVSLVHDAHVFAITSVKDLTSTVLMEALSQGVPVVCPDHCGFSDVVTEGCGVKLPIESLSRLVEGFAGAINYLWKNESHRRRLGAGALQRVSQFTFERKAEAVSHIYERVVTRGTP